MTTTTTTNKTTTTTTTTMLNLRGLYNTRTSSLSFETSTLKITNYTMYNVHVLKYLLTYDYYYYYYYYYYIQYADCISAEG